MVKLLVAIDVKTGGFFVVERTTGGVIGTCFFKGTCESIISTISTRTKRSSMNWRGILPDIMNVKRHYSANAALIFTLTTDISARPCMGSFNKAMTLPISLIDAAPESATACATIASISASVKGCGRKS